MQVVGDLTSGYFIYVKYTVAYQAGFLLKVGRSLLVTDMIVCC